MSERDRSRDTNHFMGQMYRTLYRAFKKYAVSLLSLNGHRPRFASFSRHVHVKLLYMQSKMKSIPVS